jgi:hypothetical protein
MFERIEILSGDLETGVWLIGKGNISFSGGFSLSRMVTFSEFESITRKEQIKNVVYIEIELVTGKLANAKLPVKHYSKLYDGFMQSRINKNKLDSIEPCNDDNCKDRVVEPFLNERVKNDTPKSLNKLFVGVAIFIFMVWLIPSGKDADMTKALSSGDKERVCRMYIGSLFGRSFDRVNFDGYNSDTGLIYVSYTRELDSQKFKFYCDIRNSSVVWAGWLNDSGEWGRIREEDRANIYYKVKNKRIAIENHGEVALMHLK